MTDITMCKGGECPFKEKCYRFTATPNEYRQSYFISIPLKIETDISAEMTIKNCDYFWNNKDGY